MTDQNRRLTPEEFTPSPGVEPVTLSIWFEPGDPTGLRFVLNVPSSQVDTHAAVLGGYLAVHLRDTMGLYVDSMKGLH